MRPSFPKFLTLYVADNEVHQSTEFQRNLRRKNVYLSDENVRKSATGEQQTSFHIQKRASYVLRREVHLWRRREYCRSTCIFFTHNQKGNAGIR